MNVLNIQNHFNMSEVDGVRQRNIRLRLPSMDEVQNVVGKLNAGGSSGILPEMVRASYCSDDFPALLLHLIHAAWREERVPRDWADTVLVPIPKKGDLTYCDNWRGISLLDVVGNCREGYRKWQKKSSLSLSVVFGQGEAAYSLSGSSWRNHMSTELRSLSCLST